MSEMLTVSTALGVTGVIGSFMLFFILRENGFSAAMIQSMLFLKLIVAGHSTLYITRTDGWFWRRPWPAPLLFGATFGTEILGTLNAVYGILMTPIGWEYALWMWVYALVWFVIDNTSKMLVYRLLRSRKPA
jgi:H+-transporting ATPase